ncbi:MAG: dTDP-4-dehydrorhamnose reductase [Gemmatimonadota bacterium]|nr:MAG: dTDP-4-dehydrorhamnose reductase [Gemmatimonadota bacterium]
MARNSKRVLLVGCNGLLGQKLATAASRSYRVYGIGLREQSPVRGFLEQYVRLDITTRGDVLEALHAIRPEWTINAAAMTDVDACERDPEGAWGVNVEGVRHLATGCERCASKFLQLSTDYVFDGTSGPYAEDQEPHPVNVYGRTKLESEKLLDHMALEYSIVRTALLYGSVATARANFVQGVCSALARGEAVHAATNLYGNPTLVDDLADGIVIALRKEVRGILHLAGSEWLSRYDFAMKIARTFGLNEDLIMPVSFQELNLHAPRPLRAGLGTDRAKRKFGIAFAAVEEGLRRMMTQHDEFSKR